MIDARETNDEALWQSFLSFYLPTWLLFNHTEPLTPRMLLLYRAFACAGTSPGGLGEEEMEKGREEEDDSCLKC